MKDDIEKLKKQIADLEKLVSGLTHKVDQLGDSTFKTSQREIINHEIQFMQKCYNKNGVLITQINPS